jgi:hypothetical protein
MTAGGDARDRDARFGAPCGERPLLFFSGPSRSLPLQAVASPSSRGLGHRPFTAVTGVRIPLGTPIKSVV